MTRSLFSDKQIKALKPRKSVYRVFENSGDPDSKGFGVVVTPNDTVSFFLALTSPIDGTRKQLSLGIYDTTTLRVARRKARNQTAEPHFVPLTDLHIELLEGVSV